MFMEKEEAFGKEWIPLFVENTYKGKYFFSFIKIISRIWLKLSEKYVSFL